MTENENTAFLQSEIIKKLAVLEGLGVDIPQVSKQRDNNYHMFIDGWEITSFPDLHGANNCLTAMIETAHFMRQLQEAYPNRLKDWTPLEYGVNDEKS